MLDNQTQLFVNCPPVVRYLLDLWLVFQENFTTSLPSASWCAPRPPRRYIMPSPVTNTWLQLNRRFLPVSPDSDPRLLWLSGQSATWNELLSVPCVVVLGEAGTGKTAELRAKVAQLQQDGQTAFFVPVEAVGQRGVAASLDIDGARRLREWRTETGTTAWFMLDSVDESMLKGRTLSAALNAFGTELEPFLARVRLVLSSRASDWRSFDESEVRTLAKHMVGRESLQGTEVKLVQLAPLNEEQVAMLASHYGVKDPDTFLGAVRASNAWPFLERPLDVQWLVRYWMINKRLGTLRELVDFNVNERLKEKRDRPSVLSLDKARVGARMLALVSSLTQTPAFLLPDETEDLKAGDSVDPRAVLTDWTNDEVRDLLARGLFDEATYGRARIHHRTIQEFLAAECLSDMLTRGLRRTDLEALFFRQSSGRTVVPQHLTAVAAWLAGSDPEFRRKAIQFVPEHLIDEGDPASLPLDERRATLESYAVRFGGRQRIFHSFDSFGLQRFSCPELAETVRTLFSAEAKQPDHLRYMLLRIIEEGKVGALADVSLAVALAPDTTPELRVQAIRATAASGGPPHRAALTGLAARNTSSQPSVLAELLNTLFPSELSTADVIRLATSFPAAQQKGFTSLEVAMADLVDRCDQSQCTQLLAGITVTMKAPVSPEEPDGAQVKPDCTWLGECLAKLIVRTIRNGAPFPAVLGQSVELAEVIRTHLNTFVRTDISDSLNASPEAHRVVFWHYVARTAERGKFPRRYWDLRPFPRTGLNEVDAGWLSEDCCSRPDARERLLAFRCLVEALPWSRTPEERLRVLTEVARSSDQANGSQALATSLKRFMNPPHREQHPQTRLMELSHRIYERRKAAARNDSLKTLQSILPELRSGERPGALIWLYDVCASHGSSTYSGVTYQGIEKECGEDIAAAAIEGFKRYWRLHDPLPREQGELNSTPYSCIIGLVGLELEAQAGVDVRALPEPLLQKALVYGCWELNGFPAWFVRCAETYPELVRNVLAPSVRLDYESVPQEAQSSAGRVLYKLPYADAAIQCACAPVIFELVRLHEPPNFQVLLQTLKILRACPTPEFIELVKTKATSLSEDVQRLAVWWCQWFCYETEEAVTALEQSLAKATRPEVLAEETFARLWGLREDRTASENLPFSMDRTTLCRLIPLAYRYIRRNDDIKHNGAYTPGRRDDAQDFRDSLVSKLMQIEGPGTVKVLEGFANDPLFIAERDWFRHLADERATRNAATRRMSAGETIEFMRSLVRQPTTTDELFSIALGRLDDIQHYIAHGDFSPRDAFNPDKHPIPEEPVQNYIAHELEQRSRRQYSVVREPEVTRKKKPDIRLVNPHCQGPVTLELKIAERWTVPELEDALRSQLVGTYMKANDSRHGVLVVCSSGPKKTWEAAPGPNINFQTLVDRLRSLAKDVMTQNPHISGLQVVFIDFH